MGVNLSKIFNSHAVLSNVSSPDVTVAESIMSLVKAFDGIIYNCIFLLDFAGKRLVHVSKNIEYISESDSTIIQSLGFDFFHDYVAWNKDISLGDIYSSYFDFLNVQPVEKRLNYSLHLDVPMKFGNRVRMIYHKFIPLVLDYYGKIQYSLLIMNISSGDKLNEAIIACAEDKSVYSYSFDSHEWRIFPQIILTPYEREILALSSQGLTMEEIADYMCKSIDTIKSYKRNLFKKLNVKSISQAIVFATNAMLV